MAGGRLTSSGGFTYIAALMLVVVTGIMLAATGQVWTTIMKRERERELLFRGRQYREAIKRWNTQGTGPNALPVIRLNKLEDLLSDPRSAGRVKYLRRLYKDPITGKDFLPVPDPVKGISGVYSPSEDVPLKQDFFLPEEKGFVGKQKYSEWKFIYDSNLGTATTAGTPLNPTGGSTVPPMQEE